MRFAPLIFVGLMIALCLIGYVQAAEISLFEWDLNVDGDLYSDGGGGYPADVDLSGFDTSTGLGVITLQVDDPGTHTVIGYFDIEIDEGINTFFNEYGDSQGVPDAGVIWEIDEPGYVFGDIVTNFKAMTLDNTNAVPVANPDDVSMAIGWKEFSLGSGQTASIVLSISTTPPSSGFYLLHSDPDSQATIYLQSTREIASISVPEFPTPVLPMIVVIGLLFVALTVRKMK